MPPAAKTSGRREENRRERRRAILAAATDSFLANGYAGTSMSGLLATLGGSKETLWGYFRSKEELFEAVVGSIASDFNGELSSTLSPDEDVRTSLAAFCLLLLQRLETPATLAAWRLVAAESARTPVVGEVFLDRAIHPAQAELTAYLAGAVAVGRLRDEEPEAMASMLLSLCWGRQARLAWGDHHSPAYETAHTDAARFVDWFMRAFGPTD